MLFSLQCNVPTCDRLAPDTKILDMHVTNRDNILVSLNKVMGSDNKEGIYLDIPRTNGSRTPMEG